jgi:hypothetical protein
MSGGYGIINDVIAQTRHGSVLHVEVRATAWGALALAQLLGGLFALVLVERRLLAFGLEDSGERAGVSTEVIDFIGRSREL